MNASEFVDSAAAACGDLKTAADRIIAGQLPVPSTRRWKPLRMGLMNLFLFDDERFPFADGWLLLRGSNGAGKSRVLAMTLPLLLDGSLRANRVEPDRDPNRQVAWNLLMDDQNSRTGYSWLEFGRVEDAGEADDNGRAAQPHYLTIGCGMKAVRGQAIKPWFFITDLRVDQSLGLKSPDGVPLTQRQLAETLADRGQVIETARDYRRLVDEKLFRLGERYEPLLDLLLQLRQPQLAKKLDLDQLESALRIALPPLSESLLDDAAEAFRDLDQYRAQLAADRQTLDDVRKFLRPYRDHVQRGVLRSAKRLTKANSEYENAQRQQRQATEELETDRKALEVEENRLGGFQIQLADAQAAVEALQSSPEMRDASRLDELKKSIDRQRAELQDIQQDWQRAKDEQNSAEDKIETVEQHCRTTHDAATAASDEAATSAAPDALVNRHRELTGPLLAKTRGDDGQVTLVQEKLSVAISRWRQAAGILATRNNEVATATGELRVAARDTGRAKDQWDLATEELSEAESQELAQREQLWTEIVQWYEIDSPLKPHLPDLGPSSDRWHDWAESLDGDDPLDTIVDTAAQEAAREFSAQEAALQQELDEHKQRDDELAAERQRLEAGQPIQPPVPHTRDPDLRSSLKAGAPLWQLIDFVADVPQAERANWEAALEAAGLLDAWLQPEGTLVAADQQDTQLVMGDEAPLADQRQLRRVLQAADDCDKFGVPVDTVERLLAVIGVGADAGRIWVDRNGRWQNGPLHGCWTKRDAQFVGEDARSRWRAVRLAEIARERDQIALAVSQAKSQLEQVANRRQAANAHRQRLPSATELHRRRAETVAKQSQRDQAAARHGQCQRIEDEHRQRLAELSQQRDQDAADVGLTDWIDRVDELAQHLNDYAAKLQIFWAKLEMSAAARLSLDEARQRLQNAVTREKELQKRCEQKQLEIAKEEAALRELDTAAGQAVAEIMKRLETQRKARKELDDKMEACREQTVELKKKIAVIESNLAQFAETSQRCDQARREAADWFDRIGSLGLIEFAVDNVDAPEPPWSLTQAIKVARTSDARLASVNIADDAWQRSQNRVHQEHTQLQQTVLSQDGMATDVDHLRDGLQLVTMTLHGDRVSPAGAVNRLESDVIQREQILDEKEQETLERYLLGEVADGLRRKMQSASELVELMTREVSQRPMKTGMQLRFRWQRDPEGPPGLAEACDVLRTASATWSPEEREQIKEFLARRIRFERDGDVAGSWRDHLREALDYRTWYRIEISRRSGPDADWKKLTRRTYGSGSGGEKAIALTLPQLASAAAYYETADPLAPRFILLDEAFAGVSPDMRESCMELIAAFDLDVVMTSESEWGCYAGVPQLAICQLDRFAGINAVVNRVFVWNGRQKREAIVPEVAAERQRQPLLSE